MNKTLWCYLALVTGLSLHSECAPLYNNKQLKETNSSSEEDVSSVNYTRLIGGRMKSGKVEKTSNNTKTLIVVVLDVSQSEEAAKFDIIKGYNAFLDKQLKMTNGGLNTRLLLVKFNKYTKVGHKALPLTDAPRLNAKNYQPFGGTALFDAVVAGVGIAEAVRTSDERVTFIIITDGQDNSSKKVGYREVAQLLEENESSGNWSFQCFGTTPDEMKRLQGLEPENYVTFSESQTLCKHKAPFFAAKHNNPEINTTDIHTNPNSNKVVLNKQIIGSIETTVQSNNKVSIEKFQSNPIQSSNSETTTQNWINSKSSLDVSQKQHPRKTVFVTTTINPTFISKNTNNSAKVVLMNSSFETTPPPSNTQNTEDFTEKVQFSDSHPNHSSIGRTITRSWTETRPHLYRGQGNTPRRTVLTTTISPKKILSKNEHNSSTIILRSNLNPKSVTGKIPPNKNNNANEHQVHEERIPTGKVSSFSTVSNVNPDGVKKVRNKNKKKNKKRLHSGGELKLKNRNPLFYQQFLDRLRARNRKELMHTCNVGDCTES